MEIKAILYIVLGIGYFIYSVIKKAQESKNKPSSGSSVETPPAKTVAPPSSDPLADIMREIKRKQAETEAAKKAAMPQPKPLTSFQQKKTEPKEILIHEKKKGVFEAGNYERGLTEEEKIERGKLKVANEGIYKIKSVEELDVEEADAAFQLDLRNAVIGSVILERRY